MEIKDISKKELVELRYNKFRNMGRYSEALWVIKKTLKKTMI
jgi:hypothetical protein